MKYNFDTILKEFKYEKEEEIEEDDTYETCMALLILATFISLLSIFI